MNHHYIIYLLLGLLCAAPSAKAQSHFTTLANDTTWTDSVTGQLWHQQKTYPSLDSVMNCRPQPFRALLDVTIINGLVVGWDIMAGREWAKVDWHTINRNFNTNWVFDNDSYSGNQFSHPFHGSAFFSGARLHHHGYYTSMLYPLFGSMMWEYFCERNRPSYNDFFSTGVGGSAIGEAMHRTSDLIFDNRERGAKRVFREIAGSMLNPTRGVHRLFSGEMWRVTPGDAGHIAESLPFTASVDLGTRLAHEWRGHHNTRNLPYIKFSLDYGSHKDTIRHHKPYDQMRVRMALNLAPHNPTVSDFDIRGRLATHQFSSNGWDHDLALYQVYRYVDSYESKKSERAGNFPLINEACSFGGGLYSQYRSSKGLFSNELLVTAIAFGGVPSDYFRPRRYSYASGFSLRHEVAYSIARRLHIGNDFYFSRMFVPSGSKDPMVRNEKYWGDQGCSSTFYNQTYLKWRFYSTFSLHTSYLFYYRHTHHHYQHDVRAKSTEWQIGISAGI